MRIAKHSSLFKRGIGAGVGRDDQAGENGNGKGGDDDAEGEELIDFPVLFGAGVVAKGVAKARKEHFDAHESKNNGEADFKVTEFVDDAGEEEVHGAESEDGEDVGGEDDKGVTRDAEDGGDGIESEDKVGEFDADEDEEEGGGHSFSVDFDEETFAVKIGMEG